MKNKHNHGKPFNEPACQYFTICRDYRLNMCYNSTPCQIKQHYEGDNGEDMELEDIIKDLEDLNKC